MQEFPRIKQISSPAPIAETKNYQQQYHDQTLQDPYNWLKDPEYPTVEDEQILDYLNKENALLPRKGMGIKKEREAGGR